MKQFLLLSVLTILGSIGALSTPFWGIGLYYTFAVLRPQYLWQWALPMEVRWSLVAAAVSVVAVFVNGSAVFRRQFINPILILVLVYGLLMLLSMLTAFNPVVAQAWGVEYGKIMFMAVIASMVIDKLWQLRTLSIMIALTLGYIAWEINFLYLFQGQRLDIYHRGYGGMDNNGAGLMIAMGLPFCYALAYAGRGRWKAGVFFVALILGACIMHAVLMSYSRGAMLAMACGATWLVLHHRPRYQIIGLAAAIVIGASVMAGPQIRERVMSTTNFREDASAQSRLDSWAAAWDIAWEHPLLGKGIRNSNAYSRNFGADYNGRTIHNQYLQIAADSGIPAACVYLCMLGGSVWVLGACRRRSLRFLQDNEINENAAHEIRWTEKTCLAVQSSLVIFIVDGMFLSLEMFELPWLLIVMAGAFPLLLNKRLATLGEAAEPEPQRDPLPIAPHPRQTHGACA